MVEDFFNLREPKLKIGKDVALFDMLPLMLFNKFCLIYLTRFLVQEALLTSNVCKQV